MTERTPSIADVIRKAMDHRLSSLHVCLPGVIQSYDSTKQTCSVKPTIKNVVVSADGEEAFDFPVISDVPVAHPRAGAWFVHLPLTAGDHVVILFAERSLDQFRALGGTQDPLDLRRNHLSDAIVIPANLYPDASALTGLASGTLSIGRQGGSTIHIKADGTVNLGSETPTDAIATANKTNAEISALSALVLAMAADLTALYVLLAIPSPWVTISVPAYTGGGFPHSVASTKVKADAL